MAVEYTYRPPAYAARESAAYRKRQQDATYEKWKAGMAAKGKRMLDAERQAAEQKAREAAEQKAVRQAWAREQVAQWPALYRELWRRQGDAPDMLLGRIDRRFGPVAVQLVRDGYEL